MECLIRRIRYIIFGSIKLFQFNNSVGIIPVPQFEPFSFTVYPNPLTDICNVTFTLPESDRVRLTLFSMQGQQLNSLFEGKLEEGTHSMSFNIGSYPDGVYQIVLKSSGGKAVRKIIKL